MRTSSHDDEFGQVLSALASEDRRRILRAITAVDAGEWVPVEAALANEELGAAPISSDGGTTSTSARAEDAERQRYVQAYHQHVPQLADREYVEWDPTESRVRRGPAFDAAASVLELLDQNREQLRVDQS